MKWHSKIIFKIIFMIILIDLFHCRKTEEQFFNEFKDKYSSKNSASIPCTTASNFIMHFNNSEIKGMTPDQIIKKFGKAESALIVVEHDQYIVKSLRYNCQMPKVDSLVELQKNYQSSKCVNQISLLILDFQNSHCVYAFSGMGTDGNY